jgi:5-(carboxyamino)imidazole ribonucleotide mutase
MKTVNPLVGILMGSDSDFSIMKESSEVLNKFDIPYEYAVHAAERGLKIIIAGAGGAAHLPGVTAAFTTLPVIGIPIQSKSLNGLDSLLSIVQMPTGVPVATVAINAAKNAALLAVQILALSDKNLAEKLKDYKKSLAEESAAKNQKLGL